MQTKRTLRAALVVTCALLALGLTRHPDALAGPPVGASNKPKTPDRASKANAPANDANTAAKAAWIKAYRQLDRDAQVRQIEQVLRYRIEHATRLAEGNRASLALRSRHEEILERVRAGGRLSDSGLDTLLETAAAMEQRAVQRLARRYRIAIYEAFRTQRHDYDQRIGAWQRIENDWKSAGSPAHEQAKLIAWLGESINRFEHGQLTQSPASPRFGTSPIMSEPEEISASEKHSPSEKQLPTPAAVVEPPPVPLSSTEDMKRPLTTSSTKPSAQLPFAERQSPPVTHQPTLAWQAEPVTDSVPSRGETAAASLKNGLASSQDSPKLPVPAVAKSESRGSRVDPLATVRAVNQPAVLPVDTTQRATQPIAPTLPPPVVVARVEPKTPSNSATRPKQPEAINPQPLQTPPKAAATAAKRRPKSTAGHIDLMELQDRLSGYKVAVAALNGRLHDQQMLTAAELAPLVDTLDELVTRRGDLMLYLNLLADDLGSPQSIESPTATLSLLSAKISTARQRIEVRHDDVLVTRLHAELAALDQLSRRVAVLAAVLQDQK